MRSFVLALAAVGSVAGFSSRVVAPARRAAPSRGAHMVGEGVASFVELDGSTVRVAIVHSRWNDDITGALLDGCRKTLLEMKVPAENIFETSVPGAFELPLASRLLALSGTTDVIIAIGCLIDGETTHFDVISNTVAKGLMDVGLQTATPVVFGVLTCNTHEQAVARSHGGHNHGVDWAKTAVEMALLRSSALGKRSQGKMGFSVAAGTPLTASEPAPSKYGF
ncbi:6,7-dimethyl-8-ribityllumazine synthase [Pavlovales sp. CCMP2436]|nr:6,7-dimethyl-8-ribityllumazine synthase [Pavlovales sp. CCMP2436]|mmetsp:Transcript_3280/g.8182  ORF Transcript_3280/g.8182 Transcript_3280/m.8182 type:complete len:223 (+) Transcript_3280:1420-2088(+)